MRLLALTGCRRGEIIGLPWAEVDQQGRALRLADSKEGASVRPVGAPVVEILAALRTGEGGPWVLPGARRHQPYGGLKGAWRAIVQRAGLSSVTLKTWTPLGSPAPCIL